MPAGPKIPETIYAVVEIPKGGSNKYEYSEKLQAFVLDRALYGAVFYPTEYGFIPSTAAEDNDPLDVMVITSAPSFTGCIIESQVVAVLKLTDNGENDYKIIAVARNDPRLGKIKNLKTLPVHFKKEVEDFWVSYARLQPGKKILIDGWEGKKEAQEIIKKAISKYEQENN